MLLARACRISQEGVYNIYAMAECKISSLLRDLRNSRNSLELFGELSHE